MRSTFMPNDPLAFPLVFSPDPQVQRRNSRRKTAPAAPLQPPISEVTPSSGLQFSTADRTILEELKQKILAKDAQFRIRNRKRHHPHSAALVPYPTSYDRRILDNDIWETKSFQEACGSVTWHTFDEPPLRVLDLGCGAGTWILDSARLWKVGHFVRCLESLPFQDEEFDYIHMKRVARGVPEHKWDSLFEELARVLKPGGALETIEEDLYFPGALRKANASQTSSYTFNLSPASDRPRAPTPLSSFYSQSNNGSAVSTAGTPSSGGLTAPRPPLAPRSYTEPLVPLLSRTPTDYTDATLVVIADDSPAVRTSDQISRASVVSASAPVNPRDHSTLEFIYNEMHAARFINLEPLSLLANTLTLYFKDMRTHPPVIASFPPLPAGNDTDSSSFGIGPWDTPQAPRKPTPSDPGLHEEPKALPDSSQDNPIAFPKVSEKRNLTRLPNPNFNFDVGLLNLHLSLRVEEILGCAEAMWDYIRDYQHLHSPRRGATRPSNPPFAVVHRNLPKYPVVQPMHNILLAMDRKEFDSLLSRFELYAAFLCYQSGIYADMS
ncbi:hypothetical protein EUX98_g6306 [Antrodiella citrinella]|uniref:Methyltransferase type 11 domain-containing protein n=1 Tax=Antrodiella citrinella TaxID=2447956 RepID=A0A4S4MQ56_9APHY|nr:hypothetical protein EUX98_g6306 [Antrodiella citrinella]